MLETSARKLIIPQAPRILKQTRVNHVRKTRRIHLVRSTLFIPLYLYQKFEAMFPPSEHQL